MHLILEEKHYIELEHEMIIINLGLRSGCNRQVFGRVVSYFFHFTCFIKQTQLNYHKSFYLQLTVHQCVLLIH